MNLIEISSLTETESLAYLEKIRWPNGPVCPHCHSAEVTRLVGKSGRPGLHQCNNAKCREQFTFKVGTIFEDSRLTCKQWIMAFHLMCSSKKGVSALQLSRELGVTYKTAWHLAHRIRFAMKQEPLAGMLKGTVEVDEAYVGGKPRKGTGYHKRGLGTPKAPVMVLVERNGLARCFPLPQVDSHTLKNEIAVAVAKKAIVMTDESKMYHKLRDGGLHRTVEHTAGEYARKDADGVNVHTNTAESFFALLKRGHFGVFHKISKKHLHRYCTEFAFRWDHRKVTDGERTEVAIKGAEGKRLMYKEPARKARIA